MWPVIIWNVVKNPITLVVAFGLASFGAGYAEALKHEQVHEQRAALVEAQREARVNKEIATAAAARAVSADRAAAATSAKIKEYVNALAKLPKGAGSCRLTAADVARLRGIAGRT